MTIPDKPAVDAARSVWSARRHRAAMLQQLPHAAETMRLYGCLLDVQERASARALADRPVPDQLADYIAHCIAPAVVGALSGAGFGALAAAGMPWLRTHAELDVGRWLAGEPLAPVHAFFARASAAPVLEALAGCGALAPVAGADPQHCPQCGGLPQLAFTAAGEQLVTPQLQLRCARCGQDWAFARLTCIACSETDSARLGSFAAESQLQHLRVDVCRSCRTYWLHVDLRRDRDAVPEVDELAALPLDLHANEQGFAKIVGNLMGI